MSLKKLKNRNALEKTKNHTTNLIREQISYSIDRNKIEEMLNKIENPTEYINAIAKLLPYAIGKIKTVNMKDLEDNEKITIRLNIGGKEI